MTSDVKLSAKMIEWLAHRPFYDTDAETSRAIGIQGNTVHSTWKTHRKPEVKAEFNRQYELALKARQEAMTPVTPIKVDDLDDAMYQELRPKAFDAYRKILNMPVTPDMNSADKRLIRDTAKDVLESTGDINKHGKASDMTLVLQQFVTEKRPSWTHVSAVEDDQSPLEVLPPNP